MRRELRWLMKIVVLLTLMPICGAVAYILVALALMAVGIWLQDNYELLFGGSLAIVFMAVTFAAGALVPVLLLWRWLGED